MPTYSHFVTTESSDFQPNHSRVLLLAVHLFSKGTFATRSAVPAPARLSLKSRSRRHRAQIALDHVWQHLAAELRSISSNIHLHLDQNKPCTDLRSRNLLFFPHSAARGELKMRGHVVLQCHLRLCNPHIMRNQ
jgi:hypothetical protein